MERLNSQARTPRWKWYVCGLLLLATMLLYMDRQTLAQTSEDLSRRLGINNAQYGRLEFGFGMAFALGALGFGVLVDRVPVRWLYPGVIVGWSLAGCATAFAPAIGERILALFADTSLPPSPFWQTFVKLNSQQIAETPAFQWRMIGDFLGLLLCRVVLGLFEAGHWPCALVTTQRILSRSELPLGNSILQSGASLGAIVTPFVVLACRTDIGDNWRYPFLIIGLVGLFWAGPWLWLIKHDDLPLEAKRPEHSTATPLPAGGFYRKFFVCLVVVIAINLTWQFYRTWNVKFLRTDRGYGQEFTQFFSAGFYLASDVGCLGVGFLVRRLTARRWEVHDARVISFAVSAALASLGFFVAVLPSGPLMLALMLCVAAGSLGCFPTYYALTQDLSRAHQGKITGILNCLTWIASALMQEWVGDYIERTGQFALAIQLASAAPLLAFAVLFFGWPRSKSNAAAPSAS